MYINVSFVDLSKTIRVDRRLWERNTDLKSVLDQTAGMWSIDKIVVDGQPATDADLGRPLAEFGGYDVQIERHK